MKKFKIVKRGRLLSSLWYLFPAESRQREGGRDFVNQCRYYYGLISKAEIRAEA